MIDVFGKNGYLEKELSSFEVRNEQTEMSDFILERLYERENALIEAGTGTGKTLAYLIPAIQYAVENDKKISLTTETRALQKQLIDREIPLVKKYFNEHLKKDFKFSLCLGSSNYPCLKRYNTALSRGKFSKKDLKIIEDIGSILESKYIVTRFDVRAPGQLWKELHRENDGCSSFRCPYASRCSYQRAKKEWASSNLLIMNHYLFFSDISTGKVYLPQTDIVIFDEAHSVEDIASNQLGFELSYDGILEILSLFYKERRRNNLINNIENISLRRKAVQSVKDISAEASNFFEQARSLPGKHESVFRLRGPMLKGSRLIDLLKEFLLLMGDVETDFEENDYLKVEFDIARGRLFLYLENLTIFVYQNNENYVYWIEKSRAAVLGNVFLKGQPVDVSDIMREEVIDFYESSFFISATIAVNKDFSFIVSRLGIERHKTLSLESTFNYQDQMVMFLGRDNYEPAHNGFIEQGTEISANIIDHLNGNCLMLFTSYKMLGEVKEKLSGKVGYTLYSQDEMTPMEAVDRYINDDSSILLGTHSFWQGIDLPGDLLRGVIMMKLPFSVPDSPPIQARLERLQEKGLNPFISYQVPEAVIKFKQGIGRLIRSRKDRGIVAVLDPRIITKPYGRKFINELPPCRIVYTIDELLQGYSDIKSA